MKPFLVLAGGVLFFLSASSLWFTRLPPGGPNGAVVHSVGKSSPVQATQFSQPAPCPTPVAPQLTAAIPSGQATPGRRAWDPRFLEGLRGASAGNPVSFELLEGELAGGQIDQVHYRSNRVLRVSGTLQTPQPGRFFFQFQTTPGKAGDYVGLVEFPATERAFRLEPTGPGGSTELVERALSEVLCLRLPAAETNTLDPAAIPPLRPGDFPSLPIPDYQKGILVLESLHGAAAVVYLDFQGGYTPTWGGIKYERPSLSNAQIRDVWTRVAEDYLPFEINVTTDLKVFEAAAEESRQRVVITPSTDAAPGSGGVAYIGSFNWTGDTPCWVFMIGGKNCAEAISHEVGHTLGLRHDGATVNGNHTEYYAGQGLGETGWAPIMGVGYSQPVTQWSKGEYLNANNQEDDLEIITTANNDVRYLADDTGSDWNTARYLNVLSDSSARAEGLIEEFEDIDAFAFSTSGGPLSLRADPASPGGDLAVQVSLLDSTGALIARQSPSGTLWAAINTNVPRGDYLFQVAAAGRNNPLTSGFSSYGSRGYYSIRGSVSGGRVTDTFSVPENALAQTVVGTLDVPNPAGVPLRFVISSGDPNNTFEIAPSGVITVRNPAPLDYESLALATRLTVGFELFVDIVDAGLNVPLETHRRVFIQVTDVNEPPALSGFTATVYTGTQPGTSIGALHGSDPDFYTLVSYAITGGNGAGLFTNNPATGEIFVAAPLPIESPDAYMLQVSCSDNAPSGPLLTPAQVIVRVIAPPLNLQAGSVSLTLYTNLAGNLVSALTRSPRFPYAPDREQALPSFEAPRDQAENFGCVIRGFLLPPVSGLYTFWIACDDNGELWISKSTNTTTVSRIAQISGDGLWTSPREWDKYPGQQSAAVALQAGQAYYIEARHKDGGGNDNLAVAWRCSEAGIEREVIPGRFLAPYQPNFQPIIEGFKATLHRNAIVGSLVGKVIARDFNTQDTVSLQIVTGSLGDAFGFDPNTGEVRVVKESSLLNLLDSTLNLTIRAVDNGVPPRQSDTAVTIALAAPEAVTATTLYQEIWTNLGTGTMVSVLTNNGRFPRRPDLLQRTTSLQGQRDRGDAYGSRLRGRLRPASTGLHNFFLSSDDSSVFRFSTNSEPAFMIQLLAVTSATDYQQWNRSPLQRSPSVSLVAGNQYYFDVLHKEGGGADHVEVGWSRPGIAATNIIDSPNLVPVDLNYPPILFDQRAELRSSAPSNTTIVTLKALDSSLDRLTYKIAAGDPDGVFAINSDSGTVTLVSPAALARHPDASFSLQIVAQDSGYDGLYPRKSAAATLTIDLLPENAPIAWTGNGVDPTWSTPANWAGVVPPDGASLVFSGAGQQTNRNDILGSADQVTLALGGYRITGNPLSLSGGLTSEGHNAWDTGLTLARPLAIKALSDTLELGGGIANQGHVLNLGGEGRVLVQGPLSGSGDLLKSGAGTVVLAGTNLFSGLTSVSAGVLQANHQNALSSSAGFNIGPDGVLDASLVVPAFTLSPSQKLAGRGTIAGSLTLEGTLEPGDPFGTLTVRGAARLRGITLINLGNIASVWTNNSLRVEGPLQLGGELVVNLLAESLPAGLRVRLFEANTYSGLFDRVQLPNLPAPLTWDTSLLTVAGTIQTRIVPPSFSYGLNANGRIDVEVPTAPGFTYELQYSDRLTPEAVWTKISAVAGGAGPLKESLPLDTTRPGLYLRVRVY